MDGEEKVEEKVKKTLEERVEELEMQVQMISKFLKMQTSINNVLRFLIKRKYTKEKLDEALKEFEEYEKHLYSEEKNAENAENGRK